MTNWRLLLTATLVLLPFAMWPQSTPARKPAAKTTTPKKTKTEAPPPAKKRVLSLTEAAELVSVGAMPDADCARVVANAEFPLPPEEDWIKGLYKVRARNERPACYDALMKQVPEGPTLAVVEKDGPALVDQLLDIVKRGAKTEVEDLVRPMMLSTELSGSFGDAGKMYPQVGQIFGMFDPGRYQKHLFGRVMPVGGRKIGVPVFVLTKDLVENFYFVVFTNYKEKLVVREVLRGREIAEFALAAEKEWAEQKIRDLYRDMNQNSDMTAKAISTERLFTDVAKIGGWRRLKRDQRLNVEQMKISSAVPLIGKSVRVVSTVSYLVPGGEMKFEIEFERDGSELRAVRLLDDKGRDIAFDKELDCFMDRRFGLQSPCEAYKPKSTENVWFIERDRILDYARRAVEFGKVEEIEAYANELITFFDTDELRGIPMGLQATAHFLRGQYTKFYEVGSEALKKNGEVYIPLLRAYGDNVLTGNGLKPMTLGLSGKGLRYVPSALDRLRNELLAKPENIKTLKLDARKPWFVVELKGIEERTWKLLLPGSACATAPPAPQGNSLTKRMTEFKGGLFSRDNPCAVGLNLPGGMGGNNNPRQALWAPEDWQEVARNVADLFNFAASAFGAGQ